MAIDRGPGTEIIRCHHFEGIDSTRTTLIFGAQHHIYTVLSITVCCINLQTSTNLSYLNIQGYDTFAGTSTQLNRILGINIPAGETFVWNDKFSFNGHEPVDFTGPLDSVAKQDAIADQGGGASQKLMFDMTSSDDGGQNYDVHVTYIDQNNE